MGAAPISGGQKRGGSSGSNQRQKVRARSGSNKQQGISKSKDPQKPNPNITISVGGEQLIQAQALTHQHGVQTTKTSSEVRGEH